MRTPLQIKGEFHQMNDSTDCEYHKLADSDTAARHVFTSTDLEWGILRKPMLKTQISLVYQIDRNPKP